MLSDERSEPRDSIGEFAPFRYNPKASSKERPKIEKDDGTKIVHTTVKPLALMRWLVRLVTPPGGLCLDPFAGSGTTMQAARAENMKCIGIELTEEHLPLIVQRLEGYKNGEQISN